jgi:hypothetical protein
LTDIDKRLREERKQKIFDMWMACYSQDEIAELTQIHKDTVSSQLEVCRNLEELPNSDKLSAFYQDADFTPPLYNVWTFSKKTETFTSFRSASDISKSRDFRTNRCLSDFRRLSKS